MSTIDPARLARLRRFNLALAGIHAAQAALIVLISSTAVAFAPFTETVRIVRDAAGDFAGIEPVQVTAFSVPLAYVVAAFFALSALAHFAAGGPLRRLYESDLARGMNRLRWIEYAASSTLMIVAIAYLGFIRDLPALLAIAGCNIAMNLFGFSMEIANEGRERPDFRHYLFGCVAGIVPWLSIAAVIIAYNTQPGLPPEAQIPAFVYIIIASIFAAFNVFALVMLLQYRRIGRFRDYLTGEMAGPDDAVIPIVPGRMRSTRAAASGIVCGLVILMGCAAPPSPETGSGGAWTVPSPSVLAAAAVGTLAGVPSWEWLRGGYLYAIVADAGDPMTGALWRYAASEPNGSAVVDGQGLAVFDVDASTAGVVVVRETDGLDAVAVVDRGSLRTVANSGFMPRIDRHGSIAFVQVRGGGSSGPGLSWYVAVTSAGETSEVVYTPDSGGANAVELNGLAWGPNGRLAVLESHLVGDRKLAAQVVVLDPASRTIVASVPVDPDANYLLWSEGRDEVLAVASDGEAEWVNPSGEVHGFALPTGWRPGCFSPDGSQLVMFGPGSNVGLWEPLLSDEVSLAGRVGKDASMTGCGWTTTSW